MCEKGLMFHMLFNEKYAISHVSYSTGRIIIDYSIDSEYNECEEEVLQGLIRGFSKLIGGERESLGMMQYKIADAPHDFIIQWENLNGIVIVVENMRKIDETVKYLKNSIQEINYNMLYEDSFL